MLRFSLLRKPKNSLGYELLSVKWKVAYQSGLPFFICLELTSSYNFDVKAKGGALKRVPPFLSKTRLIIPNL